MGVNLMQAMDEIVAAHGLAEPVALLSIHVGQQAERCTTNQAARIIKARDHMIKAAVILYETKAEDRRQKGEP